MQLGKAKMLPPTPYPRQCRSCCGAWTRSCAGAAGRTRGARQL